MELKFNPKFAVKLNKMFSKYSLEVGILEDKVHKQPLETKLFETPKLGTFAGGSVRKKSNQSSGKSIGQVFIDNQKRLNENLLSAPFQKKNSDIIRFSNAFLRMVFNKQSMTKRVENLLQAIVRNPILRGDYGDNRASTADAKGFNRGLIDTAQMFKAIRARIKK